MSFNALINDHNVQEDIESCILTILDTSLPDGVTCDSTTQVKVTLLDTDGV